MNEAIMNYFIICIITIVGLTILCGGIILHIAEKNGNNFNLECQERGYVYGKQSPHYHCVDKNDTKHYMNVNMNVNRNWYGFEDFKDMVEI